MPDSGKLQDYEMKIFLRIKGNLRQNSTKIVIQDARQTPRYFPPYNLGSKRWKNCNLNHKMTKKLLKLCLKSRINRQFSLDFCKEKPKSRAQNNNFLGKITTLVAFFRKFGTN